MKEYGIEYLRSKLSSKSNRVNLRYKYYDMKQKFENINALVPPEFKCLTYSFGWCSKAVDSLADRIEFDRFENDVLMLNDIYKLNNADILIPDAIQSALIASCSFLYIDYDEKTGNPTIEVIDGGNATGIIDPVTKMLTEGYAVLERDETGEVQREAYFTKYMTKYYEAGNKNPVDVFVHDAPYALLVPVTYRPDAKRPFGHSRITRACMDITQSASRAMLRTEVGSEFYSVPQKYIVGLSQDAEFDNQKAKYSSFLKFTKDEDGDSPKLGQFNQQSMQPHIDEMRMLASAFAGETGLTLDDLGFSTGNPMSYEAIKASHWQLACTARKAQKSFGVGLLNAGYLASCVANKTELNRDILADIKPNWMPIFEPDASTLGAIGDAILKINQASEGFLGADNIRRITGYESDVI